MTLKLSDTQLVVLNRACQRPDRRILPLPETLKGGAVNKVIDSLTAKGLIEEIDAKAGDAIWRDAEEGHALTLVATDAAFAALGIEIEPANDVTPTTVPIEATSEAVGAPAPRKTRADSKQAKLIDMLRRPEGTTVEEIATALGWQAHTVRGAMAGALKKKLGLNVVSEKVEARGRVYRIAS